jgi:hypothetical protein
MTSTTEYRVGYAATTTLEEMTLNYLQATYKSVKSGNPIVITEQDRFQRMVVTWDALRWYNKVRT